MFCFKCGARLPDESIFCMRCGVNIKLNQANTQYFKQSSTSSCFDIRHGVLVKYTGREKNVVVPSGVVEVEANAFSGYVMDSLTLPEGVKKVATNTFINIIRFPSTIEFFAISGANIVSFAKGTRKIDGSIRRRVLREGDKPMVLEIPSSVQEINDKAFRHEYEINDSTYYRYCTFRQIGDINEYSPEIRSLIYKSQDRCIRCGGNPEYYGFFIKKRCASCKRKM